jgi:hypothetical protein
MNESSTMEVLSIQREKKKDKNHKIGRAEEPTLVLM